MRISVKSLLGKSPEELDQLLTGRFILVFDDGEVEVHAKDAILSSFMWRLDAMYNDSYVSMNRLVSKYVGRNGRITNSTLLNFFADVIGDINRKNVGRMSEEERIHQLYDITKVYTRIMGDIYNRMLIMTQPYLGTMDLEDLLDVMDHPDLKKAKEEAQPTQDSIDSVYRVLDRILKDPSKGMFKNPVSQLYRSKLVSDKQTQQVLAFRGFCTDSDSMIFPKPIMRGYADGVRLMADSLMESRSASKSLTLAKADLQDAEYFSRRLQLLVMSLENLHRGDCGSKDYVLWNIRPRKEVDNVVYHPGDFNRLLGVNYIDDDGSVKTLTERDTHLIGKSIKMRSVIKCAHPDPKGVCSTCYGALSDAIAPNSNFGHINTVWVTQKSSQSVLSVKHLDGSSVIERVVLDSISSRFLGVGGDGNSYTLLASLKDLKPKIVVPASYVRNITDVDQVQDIRLLTPRQVSEMDAITLSYQTTAGDGSIETRTVGLKVMVRPRLASFTHEMLEHIKKHRWEIQTLNGDYVFDMSEWDFTKPILELPMRHFNMSDHSKDIARLIESRKEKSMEREKVISPDQHLVEVFDLVNTKLDVNIAPISVIVYGSMIRSASRFDYALPKAHTPAALGVSSSTMLYRSLAVLMAFQEHHMAINNPYSFLIKNRAENVLDAILCPREVQYYGTRH